MKSFRFGILLAAFIGVPVFAADAGFSAATAVNTLGIELLRQTGGSDNSTLLSPYSIQEALAMTYAGTEGVTREEMSKVLHLSKDGDAVNQSFAGLRRALEAVAAASAARAAREQQSGATNTPITLTVANRLFGQKGFGFRESFLATVKTDYGAPFEALDFVKAAAEATRQINGWVEKITRDRIRDLIPPGALDEFTRLVLVNAIYLNAPWETSFEEHLTKPLPFHLPKGTVSDRPTMNRLGKMGHRKEEGVTWVSIPYRGGELQFLILLPEKEDGLAELERSLTSQRLAAGAQLPQKDVNLYLPRLKLTPPLMPLGKTLRGMGMGSAFNDPVGTANFNGIAPRRGDDYLFISEVFHKTFLELDEKGTEAAAATAVTMVVTSIVVPKAEPIEVRVDRPFLFAIQHRASGACLFLGRVVDPGPATP